MPAPLLLFMLSLICPTALAFISAVGVLLGLELSYAGGLLLKLGIFVGVAIIVSFIFVGYERRGLSRGELVALVGLCLLWTLAIDYRRIGLVLDRSAEMGFQAVAVALGAGVALNLIMLHLAFGIVGRRFMDALVRRQRADSRR